MTNRHHVIPKHEWRRRFGNLKGFNSPDNVVVLTTQQHSEVHKLLYELNGYEADKIAYQALAGTIGKEELQKQLSSMGGKIGGRPKGIPHTEEWKQENSLRMKGNQYLLGHYHSIEQKEKASCRMKGNKHLLGHTHSAEAKLKIATTLQNLPRLICPHCKLIGGPANMKRYHFDNCKRNK